MAITGEYIIILKEAVKVCLTNYPRNLLWEVEEKSEKLLCV
jgi:hypothetical protein